MEKSFHVLATNLQTICRSQPVGNQLNLNIELNIIFDSISYRLQPIRRLNRSLHSAASNAMLFAPVFLVQLCALRDHGIKKADICAELSCIHEYFTSNLIFFLNKHTCRKIEKSCHKKYSHEVQLKKNGIYMLATKSAIYRLRFTSRLGITTNSHQCHIISNSQD